MWTLVHKTLWRVQCRQPNSKPKSFGVQIPGLKANAPMFVGHTRVSPDIASMCPACILTFSTQSSISSPCSVKRLLIQCEGALPETLELIESSLPMCKNWPRWQLPMQQRYSHDLYYVSPIQVLVQIRMNWKSQNTPNSSKFNVCEVLASIQYEDARSLFGAC